MLEENLLNLLAVEFSWGEVAQDEENLFFGVFAEQLQVYLKYDFEQVVAPGFFTTYVFGFHVN